MKKVDLDSLQGGTASPKPSGSSDENPLRVLKPVQDPEHTNRASPEDEGISSANLHDAQSLTMKLLSQAYTIAVASGKGGVGKSTVAVNLAITMAKQGAQVGLLDADIYGPSIPMMMGSLDSTLTSMDEGQIKPVQKYGVAMVSIGFVHRSDTATMWRGPLVDKLIRQFITDVDWGRLDYLFIDLPPGTGDAQLSLSQALPLSGAVVVSTPQDVALSDARKGIQLFHKVQVPVLGLIENMSYFVCSDCGARKEIFRHGGVQKTAHEFNIPFLGEVPIDADVGISGDAGKPIVTQRIDSPVKDAFMKIAEKLNKEVEHQRQSKKDKGLSRPTFKLE